jgi:glycosidase
MDYGFDGLRIDTVPEIEPGFWVDFVSAANTYAVLPPPLPPPPPTPTFLESRIDQRVCAVCAVVGG